MTIITANIQERVSGICIWTAPSPDMIQFYWFKKLAALHEDQPDPDQWDQPRVADPRTIGANHEGSPERGNSVQLPANNMPVHRMKLFSGITVASISWHMVPHMSKLEAAPEEPSTSYWLTKQSLTTVRSDKLTRALPGLKEIQWLNATHVTGAGKLDKVHQRFLLMTGVVRLSAWESSSNSKFLQRSFLLNEVKETSLWETT